jgi:hypothetical protein
VESRYRFHDDPDEATGDAGDGYLTGLTVRPV